jgi:hypothetical protein
VDGSDDVLDTDLGLYKVAVGTESYATGTLILAGERSHHDDFDVFGFGGGAEDVEHVKTTDFWHHNIGDN